MLLDGLSDRPAIRRNLYVYLHHFLRWAAERDLIQSNPLESVAAPKAVKQRDRVLSDEEISALWPAEGIMADIARLLLLTAQRKASVEAMRGDEIDWSRAIWTIPAENMKSSKLHEVPLSASALAIIEKQPALPGPYIFGVGSKGQKPYAGSSKGMTALRRQLGATDWRLHDLRRTAVTLAQRGGVAIEEIRALTQHKMPGVIGVYARHTYSEEKRKVVEVIESELAGVIKP